MSAKNYSDEIRDEMMATDHFLFACLYTLIIDAIERAPDEKEWIDRYLSRVSKLIDAHDKRFATTHSEISLKIHELARNKLDLLSALLITKR